MKREDVSSSRAKEQPGGQVAPGGGLQSLLTQYGGLELGVRKIVDFTIADARLHDDFDGLSDESTKGIMALFRAACGVAAATGGLTAAQRKTLAHAARRPGGTSTWVGPRTSGLVQWDKMHQRLVRSGLMRKRGVGEYEITDAGREALSAQSASPATANDQAREEPFTAALSEPQ